MNLLESIFGAHLGGVQQGGMVGYGGRGGMSMGGIPQQFRRKYHAYSPAYWQSENRDKLESGDKIVMPASALEELSRIHVEFPIMFEIAHDSDILPKKSHCSVMEFTAPEGSVYLPIWMIDNLGLDPHGDSVIQLATVSLPKGQFVQFQAHETEFAMLSNPRVVLERNLRTYSCLTVGDTIQIEFANHIYKLDVTEVKPSIQRGNAPPAVSIIETDIKVDFKEPRDYKDWEMDHKNNKNNNIENKNNDDDVDDDEEEDIDDNFGVIDAIKVVKNNKSQYFKSLGSAQKLKKTKSNTSQPTSPNKSNGNPTQGYNDSFINGPINPYSTRGLPLGKSKGSILSNTKIGKCEYHKPKFINGNMSMGKLLKQKSVRKEEEVVGTMRYIYEIDEYGNRNLVRRLPVRKINQNDKSNAYSLK